jgi:Flp pilus assembly protein TadB
MSDGAYVMAEALSALAAAFLLWSRFRQGQITRRLMRSLTKEQRQAVGLDPPDDPPPPTDVKAP